MRAIRFVGASTLLCIWLSANGAEPAFTSTGTHCSDVTWDGDVVARYPDIGSACRAVVTRNGKTYVEFKGVIERNADSRGLYVRLDGSPHAMLVQTPRDQVIKVNNRTFLTSDATPGQRMAVHIPSDEFVAYLGDQPTEVAQVEIVEVVPVAELAAIETVEMTQELPGTAGPLPWLALGGVGLLLLAGTLRISRRAPSAD